jgi:hypothetical protein
MYDKYDAYGPFQISQSKCYIKHDYVPYTLGTFELRQIISNKLASLEEELQKWNELDNLNRKLIKENSK